MAATFTEVFQIILKHLTKKREREEREREYLKLVTGMSLIHEGFSRQDYYSNSRFSNVRRKWFGIAKKVNLIITVDIFWVPLMENKTL